jgi:hypothetical protein
MRRLKNVLVGSGGSFGGEIASDAEPEPVGSILPPADPMLVEWAAGYWPQIDENEIDWTPRGRRGMSVRHRETGVEYTIETGMPVHPLASGISGFCTRGGRLVLLQDRPDRLLAKGPDATVTSREIPQWTKPPLEGTAIF